ncbi:hypothetical protein AcV7_006896 [Taiwanofungus camphoratus]|nr:hypothetical protein AcV7_006896 [Antrodia cinnamomea]
MADSTPVSYFFQPTLSSLWNDCKLFSREYWVTSSAPRFCRSLHYDDRGGHTVPMRLRPAFLPTVLVLDSPMSALPNDDVGESSARFITLSSFPWARKK